MEYVLKFTDQELGVLNMALGEIPHKFAAPLIVSINRQISDQRATGNEGSCSSSESQQPPTDE